MLGETIAEPRKEEGRVLEAFSLRAAVIRDRNGLRLASGYLTSHSNLQWASAESVIGSAFWGHREASGGVGSTDDSPSNSSSSSS